MKKRLLTQTEWNSIRRALDRAGLTPQMNKVVDHYSLMLEERDAKVTKAERETERMAEAVEALQDRIDNAVEELTG